MRSAKCEVRSQEAAKQLWAAEREVSMEDASAFIKSQFPELAPISLKPLGVGFDNTAYLVNEELVFRFPRRELGALCMEAELSMLPHIAARLPLPVPFTLFVGSSTPDYPWPFAGYRLIPGHTACAAALDDRQRARLARPLARFLAALHGISVEQAHDWGARPDALGRLDPQKRIPMAREYLGRVHRLGLIEDVRPLTAVIDDFARRSFSERRKLGKPASLALLHGDLYARHLLLDDSLNLCGVIDWGDVHLGRIAVDLAIAHSFLPPEGHDQFRENYGPISEEEWRLARFRALYHSSIVTTYAHDAGDRDLLCEGLTALRYLAESAKYEVRGAK